MDGAPIKLRMRCAVLPARRPAPPADAGGLSLRLFSDAAADRARWAEVVAGAGEFDAFFGGEAAAALARFDTEFGPHLAALSQRCVLLFDGERCVGTATAWRGDTENEGRLHWVAVLPEYRRRGLGRWLVGVALGLMRDLGATSAFLTTQTTSFIAINMYTTYFGFAPAELTETEETTRGWATVKAALGDRASSSSSSSAPSPPALLSARIAAGVAGGASAWAELAALGRGEGVTNLGQGFPDFEGSKVARAAAAEAVASDSLPNQYSAMGGVAELRGAIASWVDESYGWRPNADSEIVVTSSGTEALFALTQSLLGPGDSALILAPHFPWYAPHVRLAGATPILIDLQPPNFSCCDAAVEKQIRAAFAQSPPPKCIFFNTPHNPTGHVATTEEIALISELCLMHDCIAVADEVYEAFVAKGKKHLRLADAPGMRGRTVTVGSASKLLSVTGWRVGWLVGPAEIITAVRVMHGYASFCAPTPLQIGTAAAINDEVRAKRVARETGEASTSELGANARLLAGNAELLGPALLRAGLTPSPCDGGYFLVADASFSGMTDVEFSRHLVETCKIMCMPLSLFGSDTNAGLVRFAICKKRETIETAVAKLASFSC